LGHKIQKSSIPKLLGSLKYHLPVARLEQRNADLEGELRRVKQHGTNALKDNILLKQQLAERPKPRARQAEASDIP
jgi:hypothetical protein